MASANFLSNFLDEHKEETPVVKPAAESKAESTNVKCGKLLVGGCLDWDKATSKAAEGLDGLSLIDLGGDVRKTFSSGNSLHCFILMEDSIVYAMGKNDRGQLGLGGKSKDTVTYPVKIPAIPSALPNVPLKIVKIATGRSHSLFLTEGGALYGCGSNQHGQLGTGCSKTAMLDSLKLIKIPIENIRDIACGNEFSLICNTSGKCYSFGSCESGQLGNGTAGQFLRDGPGKGPALQTSTVSSPTLIDRFITKDPSGKVTGELNANQIKISSVACGKNHAVCLEEAEWLTSSSGTSSSSSSGDGESMGRVYSWGFGGYGRLGHNCSADELYPREVTFFIAKSPTFPFDQIPQGNKQKQITSIVCGSGHTLAVSASNHLYFWGKMANSPRGEAMVYPKMQQELYDWPVQSCAAGSNCVFVGSRSTTSIFWGLCVAGKYGLENDGKNSTNPQIVSSLGKLDVIDISCGYAHSCFVVVNGPVEKESQSKLDALPRLPAPFDESKDGKGKKRAAPAKKATASKKR